VTGEDCVNEELHNQYSSPNIIRMIKTRNIKMGGAHNTRGRDEKSVQNVILKD
jgi:hypothetical protein